MEKIAKIFLCYAKEDKTQVEQLYQKLKDAGFEPWMDKVNLVGGEEWRPTIEKAIRESHFFVACVSKHWIPTNPQDRKRFFRREIQTALNALPELQLGDIYVIPIRLEESEVPDNLSLFQWIDYFHNDGWEQLLKSIHKGMVRLGMIKTIKLRTQPDYEITKDDVKEIFRNYDFFDSERNWRGVGIQHQYELIEHNGGKVVVDYVTNLIWQQSGSEKRMGWSDAQNYITELNNEGLAGYQDWRLPTLEEAMSLVEVEQRNGYLHVNPMFNSKQPWIWTADRDDLVLSKDAWTVSLSGAVSRLSNINEPYFVRAVRSQILSITQSEMERVALVRLRSRPLKYLDDKDVKKMLREWGFYHPSKNPLGRGLQHQYEFIEQDGGKLVIDHITGLIWQQQGSPKPMSYTEVEQYIRDLNTNRFAGHNDWRLPTLEEAMSIVEHERKNVLYIDSVFDSRQEQIWTADIDEVRAWSVYFDRGGCYGTWFPGDLTSYYVRAVRSGQ